MSAPDGRSRRPPTALVTGASAGIGRELVRQLVLDRGMTVLATARRLDRLELLASELPPGRVSILAGDLGDEEFRARLWSHAETRFPEGIDLLINNAGVGHYAEFDQQDPQQWRKMVEINLMALMDLTQRAIRHMKARRRGQILEISSVLGFMGLPYSAVYVATKHAVNGLVKSLRYELRGSGVRIWAACPGRTASEFYSVAIGEAPAAVHGPRGEPTDRIVRNILRGLDRRTAFLLPSLTARSIVSLSHWFHGPFDWLMARVAPRMFRNEIEKAREQHVEPKRSLQR
jgi:uncharacterized protein